MNFHRWHAFVRAVQTNVDRKQLIELVMTVGIIGMSFTLVGLMIMRLAGNVEPETNWAKQEHGPKTVSTDHNEVKLGRFQMTISPMNQLTVDHSEGNVHVLQFDAWVMVQNETRSMRVQDAFKQYRSRLNATVDAVSRGATEDELQDPSLDALRGRIRTRVNRLLGGNVVDDVIVSDFRYFRL